MAASTVAETTGPKPGMESRYLYSGKRTHISLTFSLILLMVSLARFNALTRTSASNSAAIPVEQPIEQCGGSEGRS
jgi:hypothetical protein